MQYDKNQIYFTNEHKNNLIKIYTNEVPAVMPQKIKKEYIYIGAAAIILIIIFNNK